MFRVRESKSQYIGILVDNAPSRNRGYSSFASADTIIQMYLQVIC